MRIAQQAYTFDDVLLLPAHSRVVPKDVQLHSKLTATITLNIPLVAAAMDTVTEARMAIAMAQEGGLGIIHKNMTVQEQARHVLEVKRFKSGIVRQPITVSPETTVAELYDITAKHNISGVPVVAGEHLVGIVTNRDVCFEHLKERPVSEVMTPKERLVTVKEGTERAEVIELLRKHRIEKVLVVNDNFHLRGLMTVQDIRKDKEKPNACKDISGQLLAGAAVGIGSDTEERVNALVAAGVDVLIVDTAHGHAQAVIDRVKWVKQQFPQVQVIGGNITTADAAKALRDAGADAVKVGIGPGSICTTRVVTGVGVPQLTAIDNVKSALSDSPVAVIADGGIRYSGDICKAIAAGADVVMLGSLFAGTEESPGEVELYQGRSYKAYRGMGSLGAMGQAHGSSDRYFQGATEEIQKLVPEGIEGRVPYKGSVLAIIHQLMGGLRSGMGYTGSETIQQMQSQTQFVQVSSAAVRENHVHDVTITKEAPNYWIQDA